MRFIYHVLLLRLMQLSRLAVCHCIAEESIIEQLSPRVAPTPPESEEPISVAVGLRLQRMNLVSDTNSLHFDAFLTREWSDNRLKFEQSDACRQAINGAKLKMWLPQLVPINGDLVRFHDESKVSIVHSNGNIIHSQRLDALIPCLTDALSYPFGNTTCTLIFQNGEFPQERLRMKWSDEIVKRPFATTAPIEQVGDLRVMHLSFLHNISAQSNGNYDELIMEIHLSRVSNKTIFLFYLPSVLIVIVSWLSLVLGPMAITRAIMNVGAFILLLLHYSSNMADLPRTTGITAIDIWKVGTMIFVLATLFELVVVTCMASVGRSRRLTRCCRKLPRKKGRDSMEPLYEELNDLRQRKTRMTCSCCRYFALMVDFISLIRCGRKVI
uniref:Neurotransmitter-gated ion-channel ligand-binding domain-containing protein n=1 Tax=Parascaris univalens TaxID=6257 RepID=A0A915BZV2_PARUN